MPAQFNFLEEYAKALLEEGGLGDLTEEQKATYIPALVTQIEQRIGIELLPSLPPEKIEEFMRLSKDDKTTPEEIKNFLQTSIPEFDKKLENILRTFAEEVKGFLNKKA